jgi:hypothetical protein
MSGRGFALATHTSSLSPQIYNNAYNLPTSYPITVQALFDPAANVPAQLGQFRLLSKTYDFKNDGLAHYGMLPDFFQAVMDHPDPSWSNCMGACKSCAAMCNSAPEGDTGACLASCRARFPSPAPTPNPAAPAAVSAMFHSARDVLQMWEKAELAALRVPGVEPVMCTLFDGTNSARQNSVGPLSEVLLESVTVAGGLTKFQFCDRNASKSCRQIFACATASGSPVRFLLFDGEAASHAVGPFSAITSEEETVCSADNGVDMSTCRGYFGQGVTADGRQVGCSIFDQISQVWYGKAQSVSFVYHTPSQPACAPGIKGGACGVSFGNCVAYPSIDMGNRARFDKGLSILIDSVTN